MDKSGLTAALCERLAAMAGHRAPAEVATQARRSFLNVVATSIGASRQPAIDALVTTGARIGGEAAVGVLGRSERLDPLWAATAIGTAAHLDDFDDTHLATVIHPGASSLASALAVATTRGSSGTATLEAFALGCEAQLRLGAAMSPQHYDEGWHITGTCGVMGAAVTAGTLIGLDADRLATALGLAASQTLGQRESFGTMLKGFTPGKAAANGVLAALLSERGFTASSRVLEAPRGFFEVLSPQGWDATPILDGLGERWMLLENTFKPYPCGIVAHPGIDAAIALSGQVDPREITEVELRCHPLVVELTGNPDPADGLQARFSTIHGVAVGLLDGKAGLAEYADARVRAEDAVELREKVRLTVDETCARDEATLRLRLGDRTLEEHVAHARGSLLRPLSDTELSDKATALIEPILPGRAPRILDAVDGLGEAADVSALLAVATVDAEEGARS